MNPLLKILLEEKIEIVPPETRILHVAGKELTASFGSWARNVAHGVVFTTNGKIDGESYWGDLYIAQSNPKKVAADACMVRDLHSYVMGHLDEINTLADLHTSVQYDRSADLSNIMNQFYRDVMSKVEVKIFSLDLSDKREMLKFQHWLADTGLSDDTIHRMNAKLMP